MKKKELKGLSFEEAQSQLLDLKAELAKERATVASGTRPENPGKIRRARREVARLLTLMNQKSKAAKQADKGKNKGGKR